jgi:proline iminopeptidase
MVREFLRVFTLCAVIPLSSCASVPQHGAFVAPSGQLSIGEHRATLNGAEIWYRVAGNRNGNTAPVVYLAGGPGGNSYPFEKVGGPQIEPDNLIVYYDQRGTGRSARPASGDYAIATLVDDIEALRRHLGVPQISLIAHSFGAVLALEYAAKYPQRVAAAVLAGPLWNAPLSCVEHLERLAVIRPEAYRQFMATQAPPKGDACRGSPVRGPDRERVTAANMFPNPKTMMLLEQLEAESGLKNTGELGKAVFGQGLLQYQFAGASNVAAPVLVIGGDRDFAAGPRAQRRLSEVLPKGQLLEYKGFGHWMFLEDPQRFGQDVSAFLRSASRKK